MEIKLYKGAPENGNGREKKELELYTFLDKLKIPYDRADHEAAHTMEDCAAISEALGTHVCKNLVLQNRQGTMFYLLMMPADKPFKTKEITEQLSCARLSFVKEELMVELLGVTPGAATVFSLMKDLDRCVGLVIDRDLLRMPSVGAHPMVNTSTLKISLDDLLNKFLPAVRHDYTPVTLLGAD